MLQIASSRVLILGGIMSNMNNMNKNIMIMIMVALMMALLTTPAMAAGNVQSKVQADTAVETTAANKYPKSMQKKVVEAIDAGKDFGIAEEKRIQNQIATLKENRVAIDENGLAWKSGKNQEVAKVRVTSGKINFEWTPSYMGYTWMSDLSMWSEGQLPGREAQLEFLDKEGKVLWYTNVTFKKKVHQVSESGNKEEIVPPCPNMAPTASAKEAVEIGVAPGK